jgi:hypothetical protein
VFGTVIPRSVRLSEAPSFGEPVLTLDPGARGAIAYSLLAREAEERLGLSVPAPPRPPVRVSRAPAGPHGRGHGNVTPIPPALEQTHPRPAPWIPAAPPGGRGGIQERAPRPGERSGSARWAP